MQTTSTLGSASWWPSGLNPSLVFLHLEMRPFSHKLDMTIVMRLLINSNGVWCRTPLLLPNLVWDSQCSYITHLPPTSNTRSFTIRTDLISRMVGFCWWLAWTTYLTSLKPQWCSRWGTVSLTRKKLLASLSLVSNGFRDSKISKIYTSVATAISSKLRGRRFTEIPSEVQFLDFIFGAKSLMFV